MVNISTNNKAINLIFSGFIVFGNPYKKYYFSTSFRNQVMYKNLFRKASSFKNKYLKNLSRAVKGSKNDQNIKMLVKQY